MERPGKIARTGDMSDIGSLRSGFGENDKLSTAFSDAFAEATKVCTDTCMHHNTSLALIPAVV